MAINFRSPPRNSAHLQGYIDELRSRYQELPQPPDPTTYVPASATPADEPGAFESAMAQVGHLMSIPGIPFRALASDQYQKQMLAQSGWTPEMGTPPPKFADLGTDAMLKAAAFDVGRPPAGHGEAFLRGATEMAGGMVTDPVAMTLIGGGMGAIPAGLARSAAHYGMMGMLGYGVVEGSKETAAEYERQGGWTPEVTEKSARPVLDAALLLSPYAWNKLKGKGPAPPAPTGPRPGEPGFIGPRDFIGPKLPPGREAYESPTARRMGRFEVLAMREQMRGSAAGAQLAEALDLYGSQVESARGWPNAMDELGGPAGIENLVRDGRISRTEADQIMAAGEVFQAARTQLEARAARGDTSDSLSLVQEAAVAELHLMRYANRFGSKAHMGVPGKTASGKAAQQAVIEAVKALEGEREASLQRGDMAGAEAIQIRIDAIRERYTAEQGVAPPPPPKGPPESVGEALGRLWNEIQAAEFAGDSTRAEALRSRYEQLERQYPAQAERPATEDVGAQPAVRGPQGPGQFRMGGETVQQAATRLWGEIARAEEIGDTALADSLRARYGALEAAVARGEGGNPAEDVRAVLEGPGPQGRAPEAPGPAAPPTEPTEPGELTAGRPVPPPAPPRPPAGGGAAASPEPTSTPRRRRGTTTATVDPEFGPVTPPGKLTGVQVGKLAELLRGPEDGPDSIPSRRGKFANLMRLLADAEERFGPDVRTATEKLVVDQANKLSTARAEPESKTAKDAYEKGWAQAEADAFDLYGMSVPQLRKIREELESAPPLAAPPAPAPPPAPAEQSRLEQLEALVTDQQDRNWVRAHEDGYGREGALERLLERRGRKDEIPPRPEPPTPPPTPPEPEPEVISPPPPPPPPPPAVVPTAPPEPTEGAATTAEIATATIERGELDGVTGKPTGWVFTVGGKRLKGVPGASDVSGVSKFKTKEEAEAVRSIARDQARRDRIENRATKLEPWEQTLVGQDILDPNAILLGPTGREMDVELLTEWYDNGMHGPVLTPYRIVTNAIQMGKSVHPSWLKRFPALREVEPTETGRRQKLPRGPTPTEPPPPAERFFVSGQSRTKDFLTAAAWEAPFGVDVGELSADGVRQLGTAIATYRGHAFVDSGAYGLFKKNLKMQGVEPLDFQRVFDRYNAILEAAAAKTGNYEHDWHPPISFVMPDVVGDQQASLDALSAFGLEVHSMILNPYTEPIIPIQKGEKSLIEQLIATLDALGGETTIDNFTIGLPGNAKAVTVAEVAEFAKLLGSDKPKIHFLGVGPGQRLEELSEAVYRWKPDAEISSDANRVRALIRGEITRAEAMADAFGLGPEDTIETPRPFGPLGVGPVGPMPDSILELPEDQREGWIEAVDEMLDDNPNLTDPMRVAEAVLEEMAASMSIEEAAWHLRRRAARTDVPALEPEAAPEPEPEIELEAPDLGPEVNEALSDDQRKALAAALKRLPESMRDDVLALMVRQTELGKRRQSLQYRIDAIKAIPAQRRNAKERKSYTEARAELRSLDALAEALFETFDGTIKDAPDAAKVGRRLRQIIESKGLRHKARNVPVSSVAEGIAASIAREFGGDEEAFFDRIAEYAKEVRPDGLAILESVEREMWSEEVEALLSERETANEARVRAIDKSLKQQFLDVPGIGGRKIVEILNQAPSHPDFPKMLSYRAKLYCEMEALQEILLEDPEAAAVFVGTDMAGKFQRELTPIADALAADLNEEPEPTGQRPAPSGDTEGEFAERVEGEARETHLLKTFMWGIRLPGNPNVSITTQEAVDAIRAQQGRIFARIAQAYLKATELEVAEPEVPFDVPEYAPEDDLGIQEMSKSDRPLDGRYGPAPLRPTKKQEGLFGTTLRIPRRPDVREEPRADAEPQRAPTPRADAGQRRGRPGVRSAGEPGTRGDTEADAPPRPRRGVFGVVLARPEETAVSAPKLELIPPEHFKLLGEHQHVAVAKAIEQMEKRRGFMLADGTGVGKTHTIFSVAHHFAKKGNSVLIIAPPKTLNPRKIEGRWRPTGSYAEAAEQLRVRYQYAPSSMRDFPLNAGNIYITSYHRLDALRVTPETVVIFDEAHNLKNLEEANRAQAGKRMGDTAHSVMFATATPGDTADQFLWAERIGLLEDKTPQEQMHDLGMSVTKRIVKDKQGKSHTKFYWRPYSEGKTNLRIQELFERLTAKGAVLKREIDMSALTVEVMQVDLSEAGHAEMNLIEEQFPGGGKKAATRLGHMRRQQEPFKLEITKELIERELAGGNSVVVFAARVNYSEAVKRVYRDGELVEEYVVSSSEGTLKQLRDWLIGKGIPHAEVFGGASEKADVAIARFQANEARVLIATVEKGGEGVNLDDRTGKRPRSMVIMTAPFSSVEMFQAVGRIHRYTTVSPSRIIMLKTDHKIDSWNFNINASKMAQLGARVSGQVELLRPDLLPEFNDNVLSTEIPDAEFPTSEIEYALQDMTHWQPSRDIKSFKFRVWALRKLSSLHPKWNEDGELFTIKSLEGDVFYGYFREGAFEIDKDRPETWGKVGYKKVKARVQQASQKGLDFEAPAPTPAADLQEEAARLLPGSKKPTIRDKDGQTLIDGFAEATFGTPIMTEGRLPGDLFSKEQEAIRQRGIRGEQAQLPPKQKGLFGQEARLSDFQRPLLVMGGSASRGIPTAEEGAPAPTIKATAKEWPMRVLYRGKVFRLGIDHMRALMGLSEEFKLPEKQATAIKVLGNGIPNPMLRALVGPMLTQLGGGTPVPALSLFTGAGLAEWNLRKFADWKGGVELDPEVAAAFRLNFSAPIVTGDVKDVPYWKWANDNIGYLHASPECKNASAAKIGRGETDLDFNNAVAIGDAITTLRPHIVTIENVTGYQNWNSMRQVLLPTLLELGYNVDARVWNAADFGVPQHRRRLIVRASKGEIPEPNKRPRKGWWGVVSRIPMEEDPVGLAKWQKERLGIEDPDEKLGKGEMFTQEAPTLWPMPTINEILVQGFEWINHVRSGGGGPFSSEEAVIGGMRAMLEQAGLRGERFKTNSTDEDILAAAEDAYARAGMKRTPIQVSREGDLDNGGHDVSNAVMSSTLAEAFGAGPRVVKVSPVELPSAQWERPALVREGKRLYDYKPLGGARSLWTVLAHRLHNFERIDWMAGGYKAKRASDLGAIAQIARNPNIEQATRVVRDADTGEILAAPMTSSNIPSAVAHGAGSWKGWIRELKGWLASVKAQHPGRRLVFSTVHNHPGGNSTPSRADREFDRDLRDAFGAEYEGGIVINHEEFTTITYHDRPGGKGYTQIVTPYKKSLKGITSPDPFLIEGVDPTDFYRKGKHTFNLINPVPGVRALLSQLVRPSSTEKDWPMIVLLDAAESVREVLVVPPTLFRDMDLFPGYLKEWGKAAGAAYAVAGLDGPTALDRILAEHYMRSGTLFDAVNVAGAKGSSVSVKARVKSIGEMGGKSIPYEVDSAVWRELDEERRYGLRPLAGAGGGGAVPPKGPPKGPFNWPEGLGPGPEESGWDRRVKFSEERMKARARGATAASGVDPTAFWDLFIVGGDRFARGMRNFTAWLSSMGEFKGFGTMFRKVWDGLQSILRPEYQTANRRGKLEDSDVVIDRMGNVPKRVRPIRDATPKELEDLVLSMLKGDPVDPKSGKPPQLATNIHRVMDENGVREFMTRMVRAMERRFGQAKSFRSWEEAKAIAIKNGYTEADVRRILERNGVLTDYEIIAARILRQEADLDYLSKFGEFEELKARWEAEPDQARKDGWEVAMLEAERDANAALSKAVGITMTTVAAGSEAGRALAIHRMLVKELTPEERFLRRMMRDKLASQDQLTEIAKALHDNDMGRVGDLYRKVYRPSMLDKILEFWLNSILSGPPTQAANVTGNTTLQALQVPERGLASAFEEMGLRQAIEKFLTGEALPQERYSGEASQALKALMKTRFGITQAIKLSWDATLNPDKYAIGAKGEYRPPAIGGLVGKIIRSPSRWMEGADLGAKSSAAGAELSVQAHRMAVREMRAGGSKWSRAELQSRTDAIKAEILEYGDIETRRKLDPKGLTVEERRILVANKHYGEVIRAMDKAADVATFRDENMQITKYVRLIRSKYPWLTFMIPFINTPERILVQAVRRTPVGLARTIQQIKAGKLKGGEASDRLAQATIGTLMSAGIYMLAADGQITGAGPTDPRKRRDWLATGKRPYAFKLFGTWISFERIEPLATTFGFAADLAEANDDKIAGDVWDKLHYSVINNIANKTYLEGMISTAEAAADPDRYGARLYKRMVGALVPNILATAARAIDPVYRRTDSIEDTLLARVPWFSRQLPARLTGTGELATRGEDPISRFISPFRYAREAGPERNLERMFLETGYSPAEPPRTMTLPGTFGRKVALTQEEREVYAAYARRATAFARGLTANSDWSRLDVYMKAELLRRIYRFAHDAGRKAMYRSVLYRIRSGQFEVREK